jgi:hypothetical protein
MTLYWLSFVDPDHPKGERFLGCCVVEPTAAGAAAAIARKLQISGRFFTDADHQLAAAAIETARILGCNPGGECKAFPIPRLIEVPPSYQGRLLSWEESEALDEVMCRSTDP